ncbi:hypothetical protein ABEB36_004709 [Hypothenemus hampei]|uniref:Uncharacterized protein n=1 Tax=Hypothenemus hampei TaxID=57062 RepID=A0ABD1F471_HYPHA
MVKQNHLEDSLIDMENETEIDEKQKLKAEERKVKKTLEISHTLDHLYTMGKQNLTPFMNDAADVWFIMSRFNFAFKV